MVARFKRAEGSLYPLLHHSFKAHSLNSDELVEYYIEDLTEEHIEKAIEMIFKYFSSDETFQKAIKLSEKDYGLELVKSSYNKYFREKVSLACFVSGSRELVAVSALTVETKGYHEKKQFGVNLIYFHRQSFNVKIF